MMVTLTEAAKKAIDRYKAQFREVIQQMPDWVSGEEVGADDTKFNFRATNGEMVAVRIFGEFRGMSRHSLGRYAVYVENSFQRKAYIIARAGRTTADDPGLTNPKGDAERLIPKIGLVVEDAVEIGKEKRLRERQGRERAEWWAEVKHKFPGRELTYKAERRDVQIYAGVDWIAEAAVEARRDQAFPGNHAVRLEISFRKQIEPDLARAIIDAVAELTGGKIRAPSADAEGRRRGLQAKEQ